MGSHSMLVADCQRCNEKCPRLFRTVETMCYDCWVEVKKRLVFGSIGLPDDLISRVLQFAIMGYQKRARLQYLCCLLLARDSAMRRFIYFYGGRPGNISCTEDILDRIISYL
jgi:hypothetical protein